MVVWGCVVVFVVEFFFLSSPLCQGCDNESEGGREEGRKRKEGGRGRQKIMDVYVSGLYLTNWRTNATFPNKHAWMAVGPQAQSYEIRHDMLGGIIRRIRSGKEQRWIGDRDSLRYSTCECPDNLLSLIPHQHWRSLFHVYQALHLFSLVPPSVSYKPALLLV